MASTAVDICNLALGRVRAERIGALTELSVEAVECNRLYEDRRDTLLALYPWRFASTTRALSLKSDEPDEWLYMFDYPNDCLRFHYILPPESGKNIVTSTGIATPRIDFEPIPFEVATGDDGKRILTDFQDAYGKYTKKVTDVSLFDPLFTEALAWFMAIDLAIPLGGDSGKRYEDKAEKKFEKAIDQASSHTENEAEDGRQRLPRTILARHGAVDRDQFVGDLAYRRF